MAASSIIKKNAKYALSSRWSTAIGVAITPCAITMFINFVMCFVTMQLFLEIASKSPLTSDQILSYGIGATIIEYMPVLISVTIHALMLFFIVTPLFLGVIKWNFDLVSGKNPHYGEVFYFFETSSLYGKSLWTIIQRVVRTKLWGIVFMIIPVTIATTGAILIANNLSVLDNVTNRILVFLIFILISVITIVIMFLYTAHINRYFLVEYLLGSEKGISVSGAFKKSIKYMSDYKYNLFWFELSFLAWFILAGIVFPVMFYVIPYFSASLAMYAKYVIETIRRQQPTLIDALPDFGVEQLNPQIEGPNGAARNPSLG